MAFAILGKTLLFALLFITVCYGVLTFFADQSSLLENRPALVLGLLAAVLFFFSCFFRVPADLRSECGEHGAEGCDPWCGAAGHASR